MSDSQDSITPAPPPPPAPAPPSGGPTSEDFVPVKTRPKIKLPWLYVALGTVAGLLVGIGIGLIPYLSQDVAQTSEYVALHNELQQANTALDKARDGNSELESSLADAEASLETLQEETEILRADVDEIDALEKALDKREQELEERETEVSDREDQIAATEIQIDTDTIPGDGLYEVGEDIPAGKYKTTGKVGCYYAVLNSTDTHDIAHNNIVDGAGTVTVKKGDYLELSRCAEWRKQ